MSVLQSARAKIDMSLWSTTSFSAEVAGVNAGIVELLHAISRPELVALLLDMDLLTRASDLSFSTSRLFFLL